MADDKKTIADQMHEKIVEPLMAAGEAIKGAGQKAAENSAAISMAVIDHAEANTREAFAALRAAAKASSVAEVLQTQGDFVREQGNRSMAQAREIGEMIAKFGKDAVSSVTGKKEG
jgi:hypothetical protein